MEERAPQPKVLGYVRVSDEERNQKGYSVSDQKERIADYAEIKGWHLLDIYADNGYSGGFLERPALDELRDRANLGTPEGRFQADILTLHVLNPRR